MLLSAAAVLGLVGLAIPAAQADEPDFLAFGAGSFDVIDDGTTAEFRLEYRSDIRLWKFSPFVGAMANADGAFYGYGGLGLDLFLSERFVLTPNAGFGLYSHSDS